VLLTVRGTVDTVRFYGRTDGFYGGFHRDGQAVR